MTDMTYRVVITRDGNKWVATVPAINVQTWARPGLLHLDGVVRDEIVNATDSPWGAQPTLRLRYELGTPGLAAAVRAALDDERARLDQERATVDLLADGLGRADA